MIKRTTSLFILGCVFLSGLAGCGSSEDEAKYFFVATKRMQGIGGSVALHIIRKFEKKNNCESQTEFFEKDGFKVECSTGLEEKYDPMFREEAVGHYYVIRRVGRFSASILYYEFNPPIPDDQLLPQLKKMVPHTIQFAALHKAPAEVKIIAPDGQVVE